MILILIILLSPLLYATENENDSLENYPLIIDVRNYKESKGGKSVPAQGIPLIEKTENRLFGENYFNSLADHDTKYPWRYMVTMNWKKGSTEELLQLVTKLSTDLISNSQKFRFSVLIGINEKVASNADIDIPFNWECIEEHSAILNALQIPILFVYTPWAAYRDAPLEMEPVDIIRKIKIISEDIIKESENSKLSKRQKERLLKKIYNIHEEDKTHGFPFGKMRTHLLNNEYTKEFIKRFSNNSPVFLHIQDADFTNLQTDPYYYNFGIPTETSFIKNTEYLYKKYDYLLSEMLKRNGCFPVVIGGAHVYDPQEDLDDVSIHSKKWTRFASEMGNLIKHILGIFQPYGLYFHEPNTMCLAPQTIKYLYNKKRK